MKKIDLENHLKSMNIPYKDSVYAHFKKQNEHPLAGQYITLLPLNYKIEIIKIRDPHVS
jgi:hypothetical protein